MSNGDITVSPMIRQGEIVSEIARDTVGKVGGSWVILTLIIKALAPYRQEATHITRPSGEIEQKLPPREISPLVRELREVMYRPGTGTWFTLTLTISDAGAVDAQFNCDDEPEWSRPTEPVFYLQDMERFPRDEAHTPAWLVKQLELGRVQDSEYDAKDGPRTRLTPITEKH